jgi:hypothetical protein
MAVQVNVSTRNVSPREPGYLGRYSDRLRDGQPEFDSRALAEEISLLHSVHNGSEAHPAFYPMGTGVLSPGIKRHGRESGHPPPFSVYASSWREAQRQLLEILRICRKIERMTD